MMNQRTARLAAPERMFGFEYLKDFSHVKAAKRCGLRTNQGLEYIRRLDILEAVEAEADERIERVKIDADWVLEQLGAIFEADLADIYVPGTLTLKSIHDWPPAWRKMIGGIEVRESRNLEAGEMSARVVKVKIMDRLKALELIGKHTDIKAFTERVEHTTDLQLTEQLHRGRERMLELSKKKLVDKSRFI